MRPGTRTGLAVWPGMQSLDGRGPGERLVRRDVRALAGDSRAGPGRLGAAARCSGHGPRGAAPGSVRIVRILYVCTANICRSASAERLLLDAVAAAPELAGIEVRSAGTHAMPGSSGCSMAPALTGHAAEHRSQALTAELVKWADLILPAARDHRPSILELAPESRTRTFTIRQAGRIADWIVDSGIVAAGRERSGSGQGSGGVG